MRLPSVLFACLAVSVGVQGADGPGAKIVGPPSPQSVEGVNPVVVPAGRFVPITPLSGKPIYLAPNRAYRVYPLKPGASFVGVRYDAAPDAEPEAWTAPPDAKTPVYIILARGYEGTYSLQPLVNGPEAPVEDGGPLSIQIVQGPRPPPGPGPTPGPGPGPQPQPTGKLFGWVMIEDLGNPLPNRGTIVNAAIAWSDTAGVKHRIAGNKVVDASGQPPKDMVPYLTRAAGKGVPYLFLVTEKGEILYEGPAPNDPTAFTTLLDKYKGK